MPKPPTGLIPLPRGPRGMVPVPPRVGPPARRPPDIEIPGPSRWDDELDLPAPPERPRITDGRGELSVPPRVPDDVPIAQPRGWMDLLAPAGVGGALWYLLTRDNDADVSDTGGTADLHAESAPLPGTLPTSRLNTVAKRAAAGSQAAMKYAAQQADASDRLRQLRMWAGGANNLGGHNIGQLNMLYDLPEKDQAEAIRQLLPINPLRAGIEAQNARRAAQMAEQAMHGALKDSIDDPLKRAQAGALEAQTNAARPMGERAAVAVKRGDIRHDDVRAHAQDIVDQTYSSPGMFGSSFTDREVQMAAQRLAADTGMDIGDAITMMKELQAERNGRMWSSVSGLLFDH